MSVYFGGQVMHWCNKAEENRGEKQSESEKVYVRRAGDDDDCATYSGLKSCMSC